MRDRWYDTRSRGTDDALGPLREAFRNLAARLLRPYAAEADATGEIPEALLERDELTTFGRLFIPAEYGGGWRTTTFTADLYGSARLRVAAVEEAGYGDAALFAAMPGPLLTAPILARCHSTQLRERVFGSFAASNEPCWGALALSEPAAGSDVAAITTVATRRGDGFVLNGQKCFVGNASRARWFVVFASLNRHAGALGVRPFLVERGSAGLTVGPPLPSLGFKVLGLASLELRECWVPDEQLLIRHSTRSLHDYPWNLSFRFFRPVVAALAIGVGRAALDYASDVVRRNGARHAGARTWHTLRERLAGLRAQAHAAWLLCWRAAELMDQGHAATAEISMAKNLAASVAMDACAASIEALGRSDAAGVLYLTRLFRDAKAFDLLEGPGDLHRVLIARTLARTMSVPLPGSDHVHHSGEHIGTHPSHT